MNPITSASDDALVQEGASHSVSTGDKTERTDTAAASEIIGVETEADLNSVAILSTNPMVSAALVDYACVDLLESSMYPVIIEAAPNFMNAETAGVEID